MEINNNLLDNLLEGAYILNINRNITYWNKTAEKITGYLAEEVIGKGCKDNILVHIDEYGESLCNSSCPASKALQDSMITEANVYLHHKGGFRVPVTVRVVPIKNKQNEVIGIMEFFATINSNLMDKEKINELVKLSFLDDVTNLVNRRYTELKINSILNDKQYLDLSHSILIFDINNIKNINEDFGQLIGEKVAKMVANTLICNLKQQSIISRWSDSRYFVLIAGVKKGIFLMLANKLKILLKNSFIMVANEKLNIDCTVVGTNFKAFDSYNSIINRIEELLNEAKKSKNDKFSFD